MGRAWGELRLFVECDRHNWCSVWGNNQFFNKSRNESPVTAASVKENGPCTFWGTPLRRLLERHACALSVHVVARLHRHGHCVYSPYHWCVTWLHRRSVFLWNNLPPFSTASPCKIHALSHSGLFKTFHTVILGMPNFLLALATDLQVLRWSASRSLSMLSLHTRGPESENTKWDEMAALCAYG
jgi:hypothetical protein